MGRDVKRKKFPYGSKDLVHRLTGKKVRVRERPELTYERGHGSKIVDRMRSKFKQRMMERWYRRKRRKKHADS